jgi:hypothetical protein
VSALSIVSTHVRVLLILVLLFISGSGWSTSSRVKRFFSQHPDCEASPASYPMGFRGSLTRVNKSGCEANHLTPCSAVNTWSYIFTLLYVFMAECLTKHRHFFYHTLLAAFITLQTNLHLPLIILLGEKYFV